jgi:hypothetical protein
MAIQPAGRWPGILAQHDCTSTTIKKYIIWFYGFTTLGTGEKSYIFLDTLSDILVFELSPSKVCVVFSFGSYVFLMEHEGLPLLIN